MPPCSLPPWPGCRREKRPGARRSGGPGRRRGCSAAGRPAARVRGGVRLRIGFGRACEDVLPDRPFFACAFRRGPAVETPPAADFLFRGRIVGVRSVDGCRAPRRRHRCRAERARHERLVEPSPHGHSSSEEMAESPYCFTSCERRGRFIPRRAAARVIFPLVSARARAMQSRSICRFMS